MSERDREYRWSWSLPAPAESLWPLVSDTNRFNRDAGLPPVEDVRTSDERLTNARRHLRVRVKGILLEWEESPFEWVRPWRFGVIRHYSRGPLREMRVLATLEPESDGRTRLTYRVGARPRGLLGLLTTPIQIGLISRITFGRVFKRYAAAVASSGQVGAPAVSKPPSSARGRLRAVGERMKTSGADPSLAGRLVDYVGTADDMALARIRPYELASLWDAPRRQLLSACLHGTREGLLDLSWDVICPSCLGAKDRASSLERLRAGTVHCDTCDIEFSRDFEQSVEISFTPAAAVRAVTAPEFCVAGPQVTPQVEVQQLLEPGEVRRVSARLAEGRHRVRAWGVAGGPSVAVADGGEREARLRLGPRGWDDAPLSIAPSVELELVNDGEHQRLIMVERLEWADMAATGAEVTALADFRDLFSKEVLAAGQFVSVGNLAVLFTDLKDSTRLYRRIGDGPALGQVMEHFDVLDEAVRHHDGTIVKTIGDAVMAVFRQPVNGLRAVARAQSWLSASADERGRLSLKAGIHYGPCIAVTMNDRLDYFGSTVNIAARLGGLSGGDDVVISDTVRVDPDTDHMFESTGTGLTSLSVEVKGIEDRLRVWRVVFADASKAES